MKIKNAISGNKGTIVSIVAGLAVAGLGVAKMFFSGNNEDSNCEAVDDNCEIYESDEIDESEPTEEVTDESE